MTRAKNLRLKSPGNCIICRKYIEKSECSNEMLCGSECHSINFWNEKYDEFKSDYSYRLASIDGSLYFINQKKWILHARGNHGDMVYKDTVKNSFMGHGGGSFYIKFNDGTLIHTEDLWYNGIIDEGFEEKLVSNAEFISAKEFQRELSQMSNYKIAQVQTKESAHEN